MQLNNCDQGVLHAGWFHFSLKFLGCNKCFKEFKRKDFTDRPDFFGYDVKEWAPRSAEQHEALGELNRNVRTATEKGKIESTYGVRFTELLRLPYYDPIRFHVIGMFKVKYFHYTQQYIILF